MQEVKEEFAERIEKIKTQKAEGIDLFGGKFEVTHHTKELKDNYEEEKPATIAGRLMSLRAHGKSIFCDLKDRSGKLQLFVNFKIIGEDAFNLFKTVDIGDFIGCSGIMMTTKLGEITLKVKEFKILSKNIRPLPEKWHGLKDVETRYRRRYVDLIVNDAARDVFLLRSKIIKRIRDYLEAKDFIEVETPMMQPIPGGAKAEPFVTHHNSLHTDLYMRIAPELYLKRLLVGGLERVYEIGKNFRNEGISVRHNPEFTMLELYQSYADYNDMMDLTEDLITKLATEVVGKTDFEYGEKKINLAKPWKRVSFFDALQEHTGINWQTADLKEAGKKIGLDVEGMDDTDILDEAFDEKVQPHLVNPSFITDYPVFMTPLAKRKEDNPELVYRFELFVANMELANAYSELNDPLDQRERFEAQLKGGAIHDSPLHESNEQQDEKIDEDFLMALEYGMPPAGGLGIGIDRLIMILTNSHSIRDVVLFPQLKPEVKKVEEGE